MLLSTAHEHTRQQVAATHGKSICVYGRIFVKSFVSATEFCCHPLMLQHVTQNQIRLNLCNLLQLQNSVAKTKISTKILQNTRRDLSLQHVVQLVSVTYHQTCTHRVISQICHVDVLHLRVLGPVCTMGNSVCSVKNISQREAISCASNIFHLPKVSQLLPDFKDAIHQLWKPTMSCQVTKSFVP